eukprot:TRINITY_DN2733_c0_g1_i1.p3 TRINITY_DN2733_c0_g1~~TRINITY_DN2733_c0_g1_i1.p3  ORF type:complete len:125 (+),score=10.09 TRINITY_DN2733_c0_g1_i1:827-1201(+)
MQARAMQMVLVSAIQPRSVTGVNTKSVLRAFTARAITPQESANANKTTSALIAQISAPLKILAPIREFALHPEVANVMRTITARTAADFVRQARLVRTTVIVLVVSVVVAWDTTELTARSTARQ